MSLRIRLRFGTIFLAAVFFGLMGCEAGEVQWETTRDAVGAMEGDQAQENLQWRDYRIGVVQSLDEMKAVLLGARKQMAVGERSRVDELDERIARLRDDMVAEFDEAPDRTRATREGLEKDFEELRSDVDSLLTRIGFDREELAKWQDLE